MAKPKFKVGDVVVFTGLMISKSAQRTLVRKGDKGTIVKVYREVAHIMIGPEPVAYSIRVHRTKRQVHGVNESFMGRPLIKKA